LIQGNEGIAKFFASMLEGPFEQSYEVWMQYLHHFGIFTFTLKLKRVLHSFTKTYKQYNTHIILWQYLKLWYKWRYCQVSHINGKRQEIITTMRVLQLHIKTLLKWPYTINMANISIPSCTYTNNFALVHWTIFIIYDFVNVFQLYLMFIFKKLT
jgi:hypothetical protein